MGESFHSENTIREYLLGRVSDETTLEGLEELLFTDEEFCSQVALAEDDLINGYVLGRLNEADAESFRATLAANPERSFKLDLTQALREKALARKLKPATDQPSFLASLKAFFRQPMYVGGLAVLLVAVLIAVVYFSGRNKQDDLAELRSLYQQARPTETRISEFGYAPLSQLRGAPEPGDKTRLRRIENNLSEAAEKTPNAQTHHALGIFYLTQQNYPDAIKELRTAATLAEQNAKIHNDLGSAYFELAKTKPKDKNLRDLQQSLEEFTKATELDGNSLEALFNQSLARQELRMPREAKESWTLYLQKDPSSQWAAEARKNLARIAADQSLAKPGEKILEEFLVAYRQKDFARAQAIHNETKGLLHEPAVALQLSRRYLTALKRGELSEARESLEALTYIGSFEQAQHSEFFFSELAAFYTSVPADKITRLLQAKNALELGREVVERDVAKGISQFEKSRDLFAQAGDVCEAAIAENWAAQCLPDVARISEAERRLNALIAAAKARKFQLLLAPSYYWLAVNDSHQNRLSQSNKNFKTALRLAEAGANIFEAHHAAEALVGNYNKLGELDPALSYASEMFAFKGTYYEPPSQSPRDLGTLADLSLRLNLRATSFSLAEEELKIARESSSGDNQVDINDSLRHMVFAATASDDYPAALDYAEESKQVALTRPENAERNLAIAEIHRMTGDVRSRMKDCARALSDYDEALDLFRRLPEFTFSLYQIHKGKLFCFQALNQPEDFDRELATVLKLSEQYRNTIREDNSRQAFFANEQGVSDLATANALAAHDSPSAFRFVEESRARSLLDFVESDKPIAAVEKSFGSVTRPIAFEEIQRRLPEQVQLVQYAVLPDKLAIWVLSKSRFELIEKPITAADLEKKIAAYHNAIVGKTAAADIEQAGKDLYQLLIPTGLDANKQLCLVPDKSLHQLAFASLISPAGKYLLEDFALFYSPSASVLVLATENAARKERIDTERLLGVGNPDFDREENPNLADLQGAEAEAKAVAAEYQGPLELLGEEATKDQFLRNFDKVEVVHFAGHFVANPQSPGNSKLLFAGGELRSSELGAYKLPRAKLVVLSACETGLERYDQSEGAIGIARTFLALGAPLVVASQWKVDSEPTKDLMIAFHRNRKQRRLTTTESLRQAQLELLKRDETKAPFYWAAFSLFGGYANY
jgi:CHAT domain-containing protein